MVLLTFLLLSMFVGGCLGVLLLAITDRKTKKKPSPTGLIVRYAPEVVVNNSEDDKT